MSSFRRRLMMAQRSGGLPYDAEVEYIISQSGQQQCIDTGFKPNQNTRVVGEMTIQYSTAWNPILGTYGGAKGSNKFFSIELQTNKKFLSYYRTGSPYLYNILADGTHTFDLNKNVWKIDNTSHSFTYNNFQANFNFIIFGETNYTGGLMSGGQVEFKSPYFQIYDNNTLVRDYISVRVGSDGFFYDKVNGILYGNAFNDTKFGVGPDV